MNGLVYHIVSGHSFFTGVVLLVFAAAASTCSRPPRWRLTRCALFAGLIAVVVSSTAIPYWYYAIAMTATLAWIASRYKTHWRKRMSLLFAGAWLVAAAIELPYHVTPSLSPASSRKIAIIGDSVTAGVGGDEKSETWPSILAREYQLQVQDISHVGETAASALKRANSHSISADVVVVEIGGNDILGSTSSSQFGRDLDALLSHLKAPGRQVVMFELPLPPFYHEYGRMQRGVAAKHNTVLVPRHVFLSVLAGGDSTLDTIHLSQSGHQFMAETVWEVVKGAFDTKVP